MCIDLIFFKVASLHNLLKSHGPECRVSSLHNLISAFGYMPDVSKAKIFGILENSSFLPRWSSGLQPPHPSHFPIIAAKNVPGSSQLLLFMLAQGEESQTFSLGGHSSLFFMETLFPQLGTSAALHLCFHIEIEKQNPLPGWADERLGLHTERFRHLN